MTGAVGRENPLDQLWRGQLRAENSLFTDELLMRQLPQSINRENFLAVRGWLRFPDPQLEHRDSRRGSILQMFTLPSIPGRLLLLDEYNARIDQLRGKYEEAASALVDLPGLYLDVDPRNNLEEVGKLCKRLIVQGYDELAIQKMSYFYLMLCDGLPKRTMISVCYVRLYNYMSLYLVIV